MDASLKAAEDLAAIGRDASQPKTTRMSSWLAASQIFSRIGETSKARKALEEVIDIRSTISSASRSSRRDDNAHRSTRDLDPGQAGESGGSQGREDVECPKPFDFGGFEALSLADIIGHEDLRSQIETGFTLPFLYKSLYARQKAILLYGLPGTGKTEIAKSLVYDLITTYGIDVSLFVVGGAELKSQWVGGTEKRIASIFECAQDAVNAQKQDKTNPKLSLAVIFLDEVDAIAPRRETADQHGISGVNALISRMEGVKTYDDVVVIAATNRPEAIDHALMRRFTLKLGFDLPNVESIHMYLVTSLNRWLFKSLDRQEVETFRGKLEPRDDAKNEWELLLPAIFEGCESLVTYAGKTCEDLKKGIEDLAEKTATNGGQPGYTISDMKNIFRQALVLAANRARANNLFVKLNFKNRFGRPIHAAYPQDKRSDKKDRKSDKNLNFWYDNHSGEKEQKDIGSLSPIKDDVLGDLATYDLRTEDLMTAYGKYHKSISTEDYARFQEYQRASTT